MAEHAKRIAIRQGDQTHTVSIDVGTSAADILADIGAGPDAWLTKEDGTPYGPDENIYTQIEDGAKLDVLLNAVVASNPLLFLGDYRPPIKPVPPDPFPLLTRLGYRNPYATGLNTNAPLKIPVQAERATIATPDIVKRGTRTIEAQRGWTLHAGGLLHGYYKSRGAPPFKGRIESTGPLFYVLDRIGHLAQGHHKACFHEAPKYGPKWYWVHMSPKPDAVSTGIKAVEDYLREIFGS